MSYRIGSAFTALVILLTTGAVWAHHGYQVVFDASKKVTLNGTLTKVDWRNPHIQFSLERKSDRGPAETWVIEGGPPSFFRNRDITKSSFVKFIGQPITLQALPARDGSRLGALLTITFPDGTVVKSAPGA